MNEKLLNRIISVAYNDSTLWEKIKIYRLAQKDEEVRSILEEYKMVAKKTHEIQFDQCPTEILNSVKNETKLKENEGNSLFIDLYSFIFRRPSISASIVSVVLIALISTFIIKRPEIHQQYSKQEIELADKQVKHSLALIAGVFKKTSLTVEKDVLTDRVSKPIKESFNLVNDYLQGDKNENIN